MHANEKPSNHRLFDCHEAWVYQLRAIDRDLDVIVGLPGRATSGWDTSMRPLPPNTRCVQLAEVLAARELYGCIIAHNLSDLLDVKSLQGPRLLVIHGTLGGLILDQHTTAPPDELRRAVSQYVRMIGAHVMVVSRLKGRSWGLDEDVVPLSADLPITCLFAAIWRAGFASPITFAARRGRSIGIFMSGRLAVCLLRSPATMTICRASILQAIGAISNKFSDAIVFSFIRRIRRSKTVQHGNARSDGRGPASAWQLPPHLAHSAWRERLSFKRSKGTQSARMAIASRSRPRNSNGPWSPKDRG